MLAACSAVRQKTCSSQPWRWPWASRAVTEFGFGYDLAADASPAKIVAKN